MAPNTDNIEQIKAEFRSLNNFFKKIKTTWFQCGGFGVVNGSNVHDYHEAIAARQYLVR